MSADNWAICPRCRETVAAEFREIKSKVENEYGKIPKEEYDRLINELEHRPSFRMPSDLREDYGIGFNGFEFYIIYTCACVKCGFNHTYKHNEIVNYLPGVPV